MCGIFGIIAHAGAVSDSHLRAAAEHLFLLSETRGKESSGLASVTSDEICLIKSATRPRQFVHSPAYGTFMKRLANARAGNPHATALFGHSRLVTNGSQSVHANNQPVIAGDIVGVHNGIIVNDAALWSMHPELRRSAEVDTEILLALVRHHMTDSCAIDDALRLAYGAIRGTVSVALMPADLDTMVLATNNGSLYLSTSRQADAIAFASERYILEAFQQSQPAQSLFGSMPVTQVAANTAQLISLSDLGVREIALDAAPGAQASAHRALRRILDITPASEQPVAPSSPMVRKLNYAQFEIDRGPIDALKRCTRCVLPETIPFISFDRDGVCNFCLDYRKQSYLGMDALRAAADALRQSGGPHCLFTLSGGRDSCYGLHIVVNELGLKPVAYTYDWGMVTDLARRNQARMCGQLKVEHIPVSADIAAKRANIRRNVSAWLRKPALGMIPLFMAGDKQYFYFANDLQKKLKLQRTVIASNPLEKTHFKAGFCGVHPGTTHRPSKLSQLRMLRFYAGQFASNPGYLNRSLFDTAFAYASYYFVPHNYLRLFDFIPWHEETVNKVLIDEYEWELATDTRSTWRIGDGTAAFYNYIYFRIAGFSENDTFRSNQVREGDLDRETALQLVARDNSPRFDSIAWYCNAIGLDFEDVVRRIGSLDTLYPR